MNVEQPLYHRYLIQIQASSRRSSENKWALWRSPPAKNPLRVSAIHVSKNLQEGQTESQLLLTCFETKKRIGPVPALRTFALFPHSSVSAPPFFRTAPFPHRSISAHSISHPLRFLLNQFPILSVFSLHPLCDTSGCLSCSASLPFRRATILLPIDACFLPPPVISPSPLSSAPVDILTRHSFPSIYLDPNNFHWQGVS